MDFMVGLRQANWYTKICVILECLSKMGHFIHLMMEEYINELALMFVKQIWCLDGLPESIVSDWNT